uniref:Uncharacterized protein n=1 Tax=Poecilia mexicana TaxID=48701 RepID=A0A3B3Y715_9TELE
SRSPRPEPFQADQIFLLMKEDYRISRNVRLAWFLRNLNQIIWPASTSELAAGGGAMVWGIFSWHTLGPLVPTEQLALTVTSYGTMVTRYRLADDSTGEMIFDEVFHALSKCLAGLAQPFKVPGTDQLFKPKIFITILVYSSIIGLSSHQVIFIPVFHPLN